MDQCTCNGHALHLAAGKLVRKAIAPGRRVRPTRGVRGRLSRASGFPARSSGKFDVLKNCQCVKKFETTEKMKTDLLPPQLRQNRCRLAMTSKPRPQAPRLRLENPSLRQDSKAWIFRTHCAPPRSQTRHALRSAKRALSAWTGWPSVK